MDFVNSLVTAFSLFFIGLLGIFLNRKNIILILMAVELMLLSINFSLLIAANFIDDSYAQVFSILILTIAASESSIGLAILVVYFRLKGTIAIEQISLIKG